MCKKVIILNKAFTGAYTEKEGNIAHEIIDMFPPLVEGFAQGDVRFISDNTLYTTVGNLFVYVAFAFVCAIYGFYILKDLKNGRTDR